MFLSFEDLVLRPGFEPGSVTREATILGRTILPSIANKLVVIGVWFNKISVAKIRKGGKGSLFSPPGIPPGAPFGFELI